MHELIYFDRPSLSIEANRFHSGIQTDPVSELEAVGQRLFRVVDTNIHMIDVMNFNTCRKRLSAEPIGPYRWVVQTGFLCTPRQRHVNFMGNLGGQFMK